MFLNFSIIIAISLSNNIFASSNFNCVYQKKKPLTITAKMVLKNMEFMQKWIYHTHLFRENPSDESFVLFFSGFQDHIQPVYTVHVRHLQKTMVLETCIPISQLLYKMIYFPIVTMQLDLKRSLKGVHIFNNKICY